MRNMDCKRCVYADIAKEPRRIVKGNTVIMQSAGSISCKCPSIHNMTITDGEILCSSFREKEADDGV